LRLYCANIAAAASPTAKSSPQWPLHHTLSTRWEGGDDCAHHHRAAAASAYPSFSSHPGEVTNAAAIGRTLKTAGIDWHAFAAAIDPTIPKAEMQRLYDAGYDAGVQAAENKHHDGDDFINTDGSPSWHRVARYCQHHIDRLDERYHRFVNGYGWPYSI